MKTLTLITITAISATAITSVLSAEGDDPSHSNIYVNNERAQKDVNLTYRYKATRYNTRELRIMRGEQKQRESTIKTAEFAELGTECKCILRLNSEAQQEL
jgi:hypothetical protein